MIKSLSHIHPLVFILIATIFEVGGDAIVRNSIYQYSGFTRIGFMLLGATCLFIYGFSVNLAPVEFGQVAGLYIATLFIVWQVINFFAFGTLPTIQVVTGGALIVIGGLLVTYWK
jgi:hypothetical protein